MFLRGLMGGCAAPIACFVEVDSKGIHLNGNILSLGDSPIKKEIKESYEFTDGPEAGKKAAMSLIEMGGRAILEEINKNQ